jgi:hypothetical protein
VNKRTQTLLKNQGSDFFSRIGKLGFIATCERWFNGDREAMKLWLVRMGQWSIDVGMSCHKPDVYRYPGPHPAEIERLEKWLKHTEENMGDRPYNPQEAA